MGNPSGRTVFNSRCPFGSYYSISQILWVCKTACWCELLSLYSSKQRNVCITASDEYWECPGPFPLLSILSRPLLLQKICSQWILCENHPLQKENFYELYIKFVGPDCCLVHEIPSLWCWWNETPMECGHWWCAALIPIFSCRDLAGPALDEIPWSENC